MPASQASSGNANDSGHDARFDGLDDVLDRSTFEQLLEMDDDDDLEFSHSMIESFFEQTKENIQKLQTAVDEKDYSTIGSVGHFLKGSAATVGFTQVKKHCEQLEQLGKLGSEEDCTEAAKQQYMKSIIEEVEGVKTSSSKIEPLMQSRFYSHFHS